MSERVKELLGRMRFGVESTGNEVFLSTAIEVLAAEVDALSRGLETLTERVSGHTHSPAPVNKLTPIDWKRKWVEPYWKRKWEELHEVHNETHAVLAKAGPDIADLADKGHAYAIEALIAQRDLARRERGETKSALAHASRRGLELADAARALLRTRGPSYATVTVGTKELDALYAALVEYETGGQP